MKSLHPSRHYDLTICAVRTANQRGYQGLYTVQDVAQVVAPLPVEGIKSLHLEPLVDLTLEIAYLTQQQGW